MQTAPGVKASWTNTDNVHLTLKFLGNISLDRVSRLSEAAAAATADLESFQLRVGSTGVFPGRSRPKVLWVGVNDASGGLSLLHSRLEAECADQGFPREERPFKPHLTIARLRDSRDARSLVDAHLAQSFPEVTFDVDELIVFRSELSSRGSKYTAISRHRLPVSTTTQFRTL